MLVTQLGVCGARVFEREFICMPYRALFGSVTVRSEAQQVLSFSKGLCMEVGVV
jgi:hypothetical protein